MNSQELVDELRQRYSNPNNKLLAEHLGISYTTIQQWHTNPRELSVKQVAGLIQKARVKGGREAHHYSIKPIVEYYWIEASESKQGAKWELFDSEQSGNKRQEGLKEALSEANGVYIFYDSAGNPLYVGKAKEQSLWQEMKDAFNRDRRTQRIRTVTHPYTGTGFRPAYEAPRAIKLTHVKLAELASYFSAYQVEKEMINNVEALLVRSFANALLNVKIETFTKFV